MLRILKIIKNEDLIQKAKNKNKEQIVDCLFYGTLILSALGDMFINATVMLLNDLASHDNVNATKIITSIAGIKIVSELDNYYAGYYISFFVNTTEDGFEMTKH